MAVEDIKETETQEEAKPEKPNDQQPNEKTFTQKDLDAETDRRVAKALDTAKTKWEEEAKAREDKAKELAKMSAAERAEAKMKEREEALTKREHDLQMQSYSIEAQKQLKEHGLSSDLVDMVLTDDVKVTQKRIQTLSDKFNEAVQAKVNELSKTTPPSANGSGQQASDTFATAFKRQLK